MCFGALKLENYYFFFLFFSGLAAAYGLFKTESDRPSKPNVVVLFSSTAVNCANGG